MAIVDQPPFTLCHDDLEGYRPAPGSVFLHRRSVEPRSDHLAAWRDAASDVRFVAVVDERPYEIDYDVDGEVATASLRSDRQLAEFWMWTTGRCDFLRQASRVRSRPVRDAFGRVDLALLNPPFSCRGGTRLAVECLGRSVDVSVALAFVMEATAYISKRGELVCIVPESALFSQKDAEGWSALKERFRVETVHRCAAKTFNPCLARTFIVRLSNGPADSASAPAPATGMMSDKGVRIVRGVTPRHSVESEQREAAFRVVHSTDLQGGIVGDSRLSVSTPRRMIRGPAVLLPRVGRPAIGKLCLLRSGVCVVPTDCVIGLQTKTIGDAKSLLERLQGSWNRLEALYRGTCAPYLTLDLLTALLHSLGFSPSVTGSRRRT